MAGRRILDVVGPLEVFSTATRILRGEHGASAPAYRIGIREAGGLSA
jgi:hypothetical protein